MRQTDFLDEIDDGLYGEFDDPRPEYVVIVTHLKPTDQGSGWTTTGTFETYNIRGRARVDKLIAERAGPGIAISASSDEEEGETIWGGTKVTWTTEIGG